MTLLISGRPNTSCAIYWRSHGTLKILLRQFPWNCQVDTSKGFSKRYFESSIVISWQTFSPGGQIRSALVRKPVCLTAAADKSTITRVHCTMHQNYDLTFCSSYEIKWYYPKHHWSMTADSGSWIKIVFSMTSLQCTAILVNYHNLKVLLFLNVIFFGNPK